jgi:hypothetical protein
MNPAFQADSSIRGGSNEARYGDAIPRSADQPFLLNPDEDMVDKSTSFDYYILQPQRLRRMSRSNHRPTGTLVTIFWRMEFTPILRK